MKRLEDRIALIADGYTGIDPTLAVGAALLVDGGAFANLR